MASTRKSPDSDSTAAITAAVAESLERHVRLGQHLVVGLSGGIDSVTLLHAVAAQARASAQPRKLSALHVNHGISPDADRWEVFCRELCERLEVAYASVGVTVERGTRDGLEGAARRARHAAFANAGADWIMLAHHRNDQAETLLFNLLRGTGIAGAASMRSCSGRLLRPFLPIGRDAIECYAQAHGLEWVEDESNADIRHSRNFLRQKILPELAGRFPAAARNLAGAAGRFGEARDLLDALARLDLGSSTGFPLPVACLAALEEARGRNALRYLLSGNGVMISSEARLYEALRQMLEADADRHPSIAFGKHRLLRRRGWIYLELEDSDSC